MTISKKGALLGAAVILLMGASAARAADEYTLTIKDHKFSPESLEIPAGQKIKVTVVNQDGTPAEFESEDLDLEKVVKGNSDAIVYVGPVAAGNYAFFDEFNEKTAKGTIVAK